MEPLDHCPVCGKSLELQQINLKTAALICLDVKCPYPTKSECIVVTRNIEHIKKPVDIYAELKKQEQRQVILNSAKQASENNLMLELEDLLNSHIDSAPVINSKMTVKEECFPQIQPQNMKLENTLQVEPYSVADVDEFLDNLLK